MLFDNKGKQVTVSDKLNSKTHPQVFARLRETKEVLPIKGNPAFKLEERANYKFNPAIGG